MEEHPEPTVYTIEIAPILERAVNKRTPDQIRRCIHPYNWRPKYLQVLNITITLSPGSFTEENTLPELPEADVINIYAHNKLFSTLRDPSSFKPRDHPPNGNFVHALQDLAHPTLASDGGGLCYIRALLILISTYVYQFQWLYGIQIHTSAKSPDCILPFFFAGYRTTARPDAMLMFPHLRGAMFSSKESRFAAVRPVLATLDTTRSIPGRSYNAGLWGPVVAGFLMGLAQTHFRHHPEEEEATPYLIAVEPRSGGREGVVYVVYMARVGREYLASVEIANMVAGSLEVMMSERFDVDIPEQRRALAMLLMEVCSRLVMGEIERMGGVETLIDEYGPEVEEEELVRGNDGEEGCEKGSD